MNWLAHVSAVNPKRTIAAVFFVSTVLLVTGLLTNFYIEVDENVLLTPVSSYPITHMHWIEDESGFPKKPRFFTLSFHAKGENVLGRDAVASIFRVVDQIRSIPDYDEVCARSGGTCYINGVTKFWNHSKSIFESQVKTDTDAIAQMSVLNYSLDGTPVSLNDILGRAVRNATSGLLVSAQMYIVNILLPCDEENVTLSEDFEAVALGVVLKIQEELEKETNNSFRVEVNSKRSFSDEFGRAILKDIPLVPIVFAIMGIFTCLVFFKRDKVQSRSLVGFMSVISVLLSIVTGYGLMFVCGIPFSPMTQILPFVVFGVGLDDSFVITGYFYRLDQSRDSVDRMRETIDEVGLSTFITTLTSAIAFGLGCTSNIPSIYWLCLYAVPTIILILAFQLTFFVACMILDERRIKANHRDALRCISCKKDSVTPVDDEEYRLGPLDRFMEWYAPTLLLPWVQVLVIVTFCAILAACSVSTTHLQQAFDFTEVLPADSYITPFVKAFEYYSVRTPVAPDVYFRFVDQSDVVVQDQMIQFVDDLVGIDSIVEEPDFFWLRDFRSFVAASNASDIGEETFHIQLEHFLSDPLYFKLYGDDIVRDEAGTILASRCTLYMGQVDLEDVNNQKKALEDQEDVSGAQPINQGSHTLKFFTYDEKYNIWEFYYRSSREITGTTICSVAAVTFATLVFIPHWTAVFFAFPLIIALYIDFLGVLQWAGIEIKPVSYVTIVMAIGLSVDYLLHVLLRYYETPGNRKEKVLNVLRTMGSSVLMGGITTFLGTLPLAFSSSSTFTTVFIAFLALVILGITHGLILLPVLLCLFGTEDQVRMGSASTESNPRPRKVSETSETTASTDLTGSCVSVGDTLKSNGDDELFA
jgi:predicted RND superfamily exporter protein